MKHTKKILTACSLSIGIAAGALLFSPSGKEAAGNVVLASVDWVNSVVNPLNSKVTTLESKIATLEGKVNTLQQQLEALKGAPTSVVTKGSVYVRRGASTKYDSVELISKSGVTLKYLGAFKNASGETWYNVQTPSGKKGWMLSTLGEVK